MDKKNSSQTSDFKCLKAILQVDNKSCDVSLSELALSWTPISGKQFDL